MFSLVTQLCTLENTKNFEEKIYVVDGVCRNLIRKSQTSCDCFYY